MTRKKVLFRADASARIGLGHVMRCLTLADALRDISFDCVFAARSLPEQIAQRVEARGHGLILLDAGAPDESDAPDRTEAIWSAQTQAVDAQLLIGATSGVDFEWVVVDHYGLDRRWEAALRDKAPSIMVLDDLANRVHDCDLLLDQNLGRKPSDYGGLVPPSARVLAGPRFALLRPEFALQRESSLARRLRPSLGQLFISVGGSDPNNVTGQLLQCLEAIELPDGLRIAVILGALSPAPERVSEMARTMRWPTTVHVDMDNMAALMAESDLAIGAAGGTAWERCCMGIPSIVLVLSENQRAGADALEKEGCAVVVSAEPGSDLGASLQLAVQRMAGDGLSAAVRNVARLDIDGLGAQRVAATLMHTSSRHGRLRKVEPADLDLLLAWRNSGPVRTSMFTQNIIAIEDHHRWFATASESPDRKLLIFELGGTPVGFMNLKFDGANGTATWGFYKAPGAPGGAGRMMCESALRYAFEQLGTNKVWAEVLPHNEASNRLHVALGFEKEGLHREAYWIGSSYSDVVYYGLLKRDWAGAAGSKVESE